MHICALFILPSFQGGFLNTLAKHVLHIVAVHSSINTCAAQLFVPIFLK